MQRWKLVLAYDGAPFHGWQVQPTLATVQGTLAAALYRLAGEHVLPQGSGRTDAGVHALAQVASFDLAAPIPPENLMRALNRTLPAAIRILSAEHAHPHFHARHSAVSKTYEYRIFPLPFSEARDQGTPSPPGICPPFLAPYVWDCPCPLSLPLARQAAAHILGTHDFTSFAASDPDRAVRGAPSPTDATLSPADSRRTVHRSDFTHEGGLLIYRVTGSGFLHHMVRNLVGTFVDAAAGRTGPDAIPAILAARHRSAAGPTAPARGLFLVSVDYPPASEADAPDHASELREQSLETPEVHR